MDTRGIIRQVEADPALRAQLRAVLLGDELLQLPRVTAALVDGFKRLQAAQERTEATLRQFMASMGTFKTSTELRLSNVESDVSVLRSDVAELKGSDLERRVSENPARYLYEHAERVRVLRGDAFGAFLDVLAKKVPLDQAEARRLRSTDLIAQAQRAGSTQKVTLAIKVSSTLHVDDVARAAQSAEIVGRRFIRSMAIAVGKDLGGSEVAEEAAARGVALVQID